MKCFPKKFKKEIVAALLIAAVVSISTSQASITLGTAQSFAVLGSSTVTNTGSSTIYGSVGVNPGSAIAGFPPGTVTGGSIYGTGGVSAQAQADALTAYNTIAGLSYDYDYTGVDLGGLTLTPGVYFFSTSAQLTGTLTLDFQGNANANFIFQIGSTLTTASSSTVNVINGDALSGIYWQVGSSATIGTSTMFVGNILADQSITLNTTADILCGRAIALNGAVTMDTNRISNNNSAQDYGSGRSDFGSYGFSGGDGTTVVPTPSAFLLLGSGLSSLLFYGKRLFS